MDVAIRDAMLPELEGREFFRRLGEIEVSSVEIDVLPDGQTPWVRDDGGAPHSIKDMPAVKRLKRRLDDEGLRVGALLVSTDFSSPQADDHVEWAVKTVWAARELGAPAIRIDPLSWDKGVSGPAARDNFIRAAGQVLRRTEGVDVDLGMENHGPYANDPIFIDAVLAALPDSRLGLTLDTGNFYWFGFPLEEVYQLIEKYAPAVKHTHVKSINYPPDVANRRRPVGHEYRQACCALHEGNLDLRRVIRILGGAGYERDLCVEDESLFKHPPEQRVDVLKREVRALREALEEVRG